MIDGVEVELLVIPDCPHDASAHELLRRALDDVGLDGVGIRTTIIDSQELAEQRGFTGSPTILLNGRDPFEQPDRKPGVACRVYDSPGGHSGIPELRALRQALKREAALHSEGGNRRER
jgi:hypothetical protein